MALISTTRKSVRFKSSLRSNNNSKSLSTLLSCTSSSTTCVTPVSAGSPNSRRKRIPMVMKCSRVLSLSFDSSRTLYPTTSPHRSRRSEETRSARPIALILLGCVHTMFTSPPLPLKISLSKMNCGTWVDLPHPVSPERITTGCFETAATTSSRDPLAGSAARVATIFLELKSLPFAK